MKNSFYTCQHIKMLSFLVMLTLSLTVSGMALKPANIFCDHMVLQRDKKVPIWGFSAPKEKVKVKFAGQSKTTKANSYGKWIVYLDKLEMCSDGQELVISTKKDEVILKDILVGEVWICAGQSNMFWPAKGIPAINRLKPLVKNTRSFYVKNLVALEEQDEVHGEWKVGPPVSAVAFSFSYYLNSLSEIPVGIIQAAWGSSSLEAWMPRSLQQELPLFDTIMTEFDADVDKIKRIEALIEKTTWTNKENVFLRRHPNIIYNAMMHPLIPFACRGLMWYQGERNTRYMEGMPKVKGDKWFHRVCGIKDYDTALQKWMLNYRKQWQDNDMHFMLVMLPGYGKGTEQKKNIDPESPTEPSWAWMRESQMTALNIPNVSVVNTIDLGDVKNIHPLDKEPVGQRAALLAAKNTLNLPVNAMGPTMYKIEIKETELVVHFKNADGLKTTNRKAPSGFWITDDTKKWVKANAVIKGETVVLSASEIQAPKYIRYAFAGKPSVNLVNDSELPAYPFRTDNWDN